MTSGSAPLTASDCCTSGTGTPELHFGPDERANHRMHTEPKVHDPAVTVAELREFFEDDHVHAALLVTAEGRLVAVVERADLVAAPSAEPAARFGRLAERTVSPEARLVEVLPRLGHTGRLAVVDAAGLLLGLLCLKRRRTGFCSDADVAARAADHRSNCP